LQKPTGGEPRPGDAAQTTRDQAPAPDPLHRMTSRARRAVMDRARRRAAAAGAATSAALRPFTTAERALPIAVASIVAVAALLAFMPGTRQGAVTGTQASLVQPRLAVNGGVEREAQDIPDSVAALVAPDDVSFQPIRIPDLQGGTGGSVTAPVTAPAESPEPSVRSDTLADPVADDPDFTPAVKASPTPEPTPSVESAVLEDGTLLTGYAPETAVEDGAALIRRYTVQKGDTLTSVAKKFDVSMMTLWWANKLKKKDLKAGQELRIPPVSGLVYTVKDTDTLEAVAKRFKVKADKVVELNGLADPTLVVGQVLVLPGAKGAPMPTPKPVTKSGTKSAGGSGGVLGGGPANYAGGAMRWPVVGGDNYISQYYHYGHYGLDIAADYGSKVVATAPGKVIFAGWKSNGGGYQVWIAHGSGIYTTYNHMSAVTVNGGESVSKGEQVGRIGQSGYATGPHLHFEVWNGRVWDGGTRVNPLKYF
jgi:murein DD-endopeptidase MepM/ murein hydrolase activator NlpD